MLKTAIKGKVRWITIGTHGSPWTVATARNEAQRILGEIVSGADIVGIRAPKDDDKTVRALGERYLSDHAAIYKKASSTKTDQGHLRNHIYPLIGTRRVADISFADIEKLLRAIAEGKTAAPKGTVGNQGSAVPSGGKIVANRCRSLLSKMFNLSERWNWRSRSTNPVKDTVKFKEVAVERYLADKEMEILGEALQKEKSKSPYAVAAIRLLLLTGARKSEILTLQWRDVDVQRGLFWIRDSKTGRRSHHLPEAAVAILEDLPRIDGNPFVICGAKKDAHLVNLQKPWNRIRKSAVLPELRIHNLRHNFASILASDGVSLQIIGKLLGHQNIATTQRYAHLTDSVVKAAGSRAAEKISSLSSG